MKKKKIEKKRRKKRKRAPNYSGNMLQARLASKPSPMSAIEAKYMGAFVHPRHSSIPSTARIVFLSIIILNKVINFVREIV